MSLDLTNLDLDTIPDRPEGCDRFVGVFVMDRPDPAGTDPDTGADEGALTLDFLREMVELKGGDPSKVYLRSVSINAETATTAFGLDGLPES